LYYFFSLGISLILVILKRSKFSRGDYIVFFLYAYCQKFISNIFSLFISYTLQSNYINKKDIKERNVSQTKYIIHNNNIYKTRYEVDNNVPHHKLTTTEAVFLAHLRQCCLKFRAQNTARRTALRKRMRSCFCKIKARKRVSRRSTGLGICVTSELSRTALSYESLRFMTAAKFLLFMSNEFLRKSSNKLRFLLTFGNNNGNVTALLARFHGNNPPTGTGMDSRRRWDILANWSRAKLASCDCSRTSLFERSNFGNLSLLEEDILFSD